MQLSLHNVAKIKRSTRTMKSDDGLFSDCDVTTLEITQVNGERNTIVLFHADNVESDYVLQNIW